MSECILTHAWWMAAASDFAAASLHLAIIVGGPSWYRAFGAGETLAKLAEHGHIWPPILTGVIALVLSTFGFYAASAGGWFPWLPHPQLGLAIVAAIYLLRGMAPWPMMLWVRSLRTPFFVWTSCLSAAMGLIHLAAWWANTTT